MRSATATGADHRRRPLDRLATECLEFAPLRDHEPGTHWFVGAAAFTSAARPTDCGPRLIGLRSLRSSSDCRSQSTLTPPFLSAPFLYTPLRRRRSSDGRPTARAAFRFASPPQSEPVGDRDATPIDWFWFRLMIVRRCHPGCVPDLAQQTLCVRSSHSSFRT